jgi:hypothetical protein
MFAAHRSRTLRTIIVTGLLGLGLGLALGTSLPITSGAHAQGDDHVQFSSSAFDTPAVLATGTRDAPGLAASSARNVAVDAYSTAGIGVRGRSNGSADGVEGMSASGVGGFFAGGAAALHLVPALTTGHPLSGLHLRGDLLMDRTGRLWVCVANGSPGTWHQILTAAK